MENVVKLPIELIWKESLGPRGHLQIMQIVLMRHRMLLSVQQAYMVAR